MRDIRSAFGARGPALLSFGVILVIASILLSVRVLQTEIDFDGTVSQISFRLTAQQTILGTTKINAIGIAGVQDIHFPLGSEMLLSGDRTQAQQINAVRYSLPENSSGSITLSAVILPKGTRVTLSAGKANLYRLSLEAPKGTRFPVTVSINGNIYVGFFEIGGMLLDSKTPKAFTILGSVVPMDLDISCPTGIAPALESDLDVDDIVFARIEETGDDLRTEVRRLPTVESGTLYFDSLNGKSIAIRAGEALQFSRSEGALRSAEITDKGIRVLFSGEVRGMTAGSPRAPVKLMPTLLHWLAANQTLGLLWSALLFLFGLWMTITKWWSDGRGDKS
jgi:hypothetical protein